MAWKQRYMRTPLYCRQCIGSGSALDPHAMARGLKLAKLKIKT
jgi:hypothetical protein